MLLISIFYVLLRITFSSGAQKGNIMIKLNLATGAVGHRFILKLSDLVMMVVQNGGNT